MPLNFYKALADSGDVLEDAIQPYEAGEAANSSILNRPIQNVRNRSEMIRSREDFQALLNRSDRGFVFVSEPDTQLHFKNEAGGYSFRLNSTGGWEQWDRDLVMVPIASASLLSGTAPITTKYIFDDGIVPAGKFSVYPLVGAVLRKVANGASNLLIKIFKTAGDNLPGGPIVTIEGAANPNAPDPEAGPVTICIQVADNNTSTITQVVDAINDHVGAASIVTAGEVENGSHTITLGSTIGPVRFYTPLGCIGGVDDEGFKITGLELKNYFDIDVDHKLQEGSVLVLDFLGAKERLSQDTNSSISTVLRTIHAGSSPGDTRNAADCIGTVPICKLFGGHLYFSNGRMFEPATDAAFLDDLTALRKELAGATADESGDTMIGAEAKAGSGTTVFTLASGTVSSQLTTLADLGRTTAGNGAALVGSEEVAAVDHFAALPAGTFRSQIQAMLDQLSSQTGSTTDGVYRVGADAYLTRLTQGYISNQLHECWVDQVDHDRGTADQHKFADLSNRPFVFVSQTAGEGDYQTINLAIQAIKTTGGTVYIKGNASPYIESCLLASATIANPIEVIALGNVVWRVGATSCFTLDSGSTLQNRIVFRNIRFQSSSGGTTAITIQATASYAQGRVECYDCIFESYSIYECFPINWASYNKLVMHRCFASNLSTSTSSTPAITAAGGSLDVRECKFMYYGKICTYDGSSDKGDVDFFENEFYKCGYATSFATLLFLFTVTNGARLVRLCNNDYPYFDHTGTNRYAKFCSIIDAVDSIVTGNSLYLAIPSAFTAGSAEWAIRTDLVSGAKRSQISTNYLAAIGTLGGIRSSYPQTIVEGNQMDGLYDQYSSNLGHIYVPSGDFAIIRSNRVVSSDSATQQLRILLGIGTLTVGGIISDNYLWGGSHNSGVLYSDSSNLMILRNTIKCYTGASSGYGVSLGSTRTGLIVSENKLLDVGRGVLQPGGGGGRLICGHNLFDHVNAAVLADSIIGGGDLLLASGNTMKFLTQTSRVGINEAYAVSVHTRNRTNNCQYAYYSTLAGHHIFSDNSILTSSVAGIQRNAAGLTACGNRIVGDGTTSSLGMRIDYASGEHVLGANYLSNVGQGIVFYNTSSAVAAEFCVIVGNIIQLIAAMTSGGDGISFPVNPTTPAQTRHSAIAGNVVTKTVYTSGVGEGIMYGGNMIAMWQNVVRSGNSGANYYFASAFQGVSAGGVGLGADITTDATVPTYNLTTTTA